MMIIVSNSIKHVVLNESDSYKASDIPSSYWVEEPIHVVWSNNLNQKLTY